jgi:sugar lactone lactonase YvrE
MDREATALAGGLYFGEGPRWRDGRLWLSDFYAHAVKSVSEAGDVRVEVTLDDQPSGLGWSADGDLLVVAMRGRRLLKRGRNGALAPFAELSGVATYHCNDMTVDASGGAYVGNFGFDLDKELLARGPESVLADHPKAKLARVAPDGTVSVAAEDMSFPNGSVITPDGKTLIIAETLGLRLTAFDIGAAGALLNRRVFAPTGQVVPDGICLDASGAVWVSNALGPQCVRIAPGGEVLDVVHTSQNCFACMLGGEDGKTLFLLTAPTSLAAMASAAANGKIETVRVESPHAGRP